MSESGESPKKAANEESRPKTLGERYVEGHFHPHTELPEEIPAEIADALQQSIENYSAEKRAETLLHYRRVWLYLRTGIGELCMGKAKSWEDAVEYIVKRLHNEEATLPGGPGSSAASNYIHLFRTFSVLAYLEAGNIPYEFLDFEKPEEIGKRMAEYIDALEKKAQAHERESVKIQLLDSEIRPADKKAIALKEKEAQEKLDQVRQEIKDLPEDQPVDTLIVRHFVEAAKEVTRYAGEVPFYAQAINLSRYRRERDKTFEQELLKLLSADEQLVYSDAKREAKQSGSFFMTSYLFKEARETVEKKLRRYLD